MTAPLAVLLDGRKIGTVAAGGAHFDYDSDYLASGNAAIPLSLSMPLSQQRHAGEMIRRVRRPTTSPICSTRGPTTG